VRSFWVRKNIIAKRISRQTGIFICNHGYFLDYSFEVKKLVATCRQLRGLRSWTLGAKFLAYLFERISSVFVCVHALQLEGYLIMDDSEFRLPSVCICQAYHLIGASQPRHSFGTLEDHENGGGRPIQQTQAAQRRHHHLEDGEGNHPGPNKMDPPPNN